MEAQLIAPERLNHVPEPIQHVLAQVKRELISFYGGRLQQLILFGSYARGDFHEESDIDLMPVVDSTSMEALRHDELFDISYPYLLQHQIKVSFVPVLAERYERADTFLLMFVHQEGISLWKSGLSNS